MDVGVFVGLWFVGLRLCTRTYVRIWVFVAYQVIVNILRPTHRHRCREAFLSVRAMRNARNIRSQLEGEVRRALGPKTELTQAKSIDSISRAITAGMCMLVCVYMRVYVRAPYVHVRM
jgi:hypothetical protein